MRKIILLLLLTVVHPLVAKAQHYDHKIIAVLPFKTVLAEFSQMSDSAVRAFRTLEIKFGIQFQEALYQAMTSDTSRLLVEVQPWQTTDSLLKKAGLDLLKLPYMDIAAIAKLLKVDACVVTVMRHSRPAGAAAGLGTGGLVGLPVMLAVNEGVSQAVNHINWHTRMLTFQLMDGKSGNEIWNLSQQMSTADVSWNKDQLVISPLVFKRFKKRFPYCD